MSDTVFTNGLIVKRNPNAPEYVLCKLSIKVDEFAAFMDEHKDGEWINIDCKVGRSGKPYAQLDTWKPDRDKQGSSEPANEDVPF